MDKNTKIKTAKSMSDQQVYTLFATTISYMIQYYSGHIDEFGKIHENFQGKWKEVIIKSGEKISDFSGGEKFLKVLKDTPRLIKKEKQQVLYPINSSAYSLEIKEHVKNIFNDKEIFTVMYNRYFDERVMNYFSLLMNKINDDLKVGINKRLSDKKLGDLTKEGASLDKYFDELLKNLNLNHIEEYFAQSAFDFLEKIDNEESLNFYNLIYRWNKGALTFLQEDLKNKGIDIQKIDGKIGFLSPNIIELFEKNPRLKASIKDGEIDEQYFSAHIDLQNIENAKRASKLP